MKTRLHRAGCGSSVFWLSVQEPGATVAHFQTAHPEENVLGDVRRVVGDALQMARGEKKVKIRSGERGLRGSSPQKVFKQLAAMAPSGGIVFGVEGGGG